LERKHNVGRRTVVKALKSAWPEPRKKPPPRPSKLDPSKPVIDEVLPADPAALVYRPFYFQPGLHGLGELPHRQTP
jgi:hypothetical protein